MGGGGPSGVARHAARVSHVAHAHQHSGTRERDGGRRDRAEETGPRAASQWRPSSVRLGQGHKRQELRADGREGAAGLAAPA